MPAVRRLVNATWRIGLAFAASCGALSLQGRCAWAAESGDRESRPGEAMISFAPFGEPYESMSLDLRIAGTDELVHIPSSGGVLRVEGDPVWSVHVNDMWLPALPGETTRLHSTACCALAFSDPGYHDPAEAICGEKPDGYYGRTDCPDLTEEVSPGHAVDPICPPESHGRCVLMPQVRAVAVEGLNSGGHVEVYGDTSIPIARSEAEAIYVPVARGPSMMPRFRLRLTGEDPAGDARGEKVALWTGWRYTVLVGPDGIVGVERDGRVAPRGEVPEPSR